MKTLCIPTSLLLLVACSGGEKVTSTDTIGTSGTQTTGTTSTTSTGSSGGTVSSLNAEDKEFFISTAQANSAEVNLGHLATDKATSADVKNFARRMVTDDLSKKVGKDFDHSYMDQMIRDHESVVKAFEKASTSATDPDLKSWVVKTLPILKDHLTTAKQIGSKLR